MKKVKMLLDHYKATKHPFADVVEALLKNTNHSEYAMENLRLLLDHAEMDFEEEKRARAAAIKRALKEMGKI